MTKDKAPEGEQDDTKVAGSEAGSAVGHDEERVGNAISDDSIDAEETGAEARAE